MHDKQRNITRTGHLMPTQQVKTLVGITEFNDKTGKNLSSCLDNVTRVTLQGIARLTSKSVDTDKFYASASCAPLALAARVCVERYLDKPRLCSKEMISFSDSTNNNFQLYLTVDDPDLSIIKLDQEWNRSHKAQIWNLFRCRPSRKGQLD